MENKIQLTETQKNLVSRLPLFKGKSDRSVEDIFDRLDYEGISIDKGDILIKQNTPCLHLYILLKGNLEVNIIDISGISVKVEDLEAPRTFATPHLFDEEGLFPATFTATEECILFKATKDSVFNLISSEPDILKNFLRITGNCNACTVNRLRVLSYKGIRSRFIYYIFDHKTSSDTAILKHNQTQLAEYMSVSRPALANEIKKLVEEKLIVISGRDVTILNTQALMQYL